MMRTSNLFPLVRRYSKQKASRVQSTTNVQENSLEIIKRNNFNHLVMIAHKTGSIDIVRYKRDLALYVTALFMISLLILVYHYNL